MLLEIKKALLSQKENILRANQEDIKKGRENNMPEGLIDRLLLTDERIEAMAKSIDEVIDFKDPVGKVLSMEENYAGLFNW